MSHQDFERYAVEKPFGAAMPKTWVKAFREVAHQFNLPSKRLRVLDVGCGDGRIYPFLLDEGFLPGNIHGIEVSKARIERCRELGWEKAIYVRSEEKLPYVDNQFHIINFMEVIEHIPEEDIENLLLELNRILKMDGCLLITTPNYPIKRFYDIYAAAVHGKKERWTDDATHVSFYNHNRLIRLMQNFFMDIESRPFKDGFLYKYFHLPFFRHKICFLCKNKKRIGTGIENI